MFGGFEDSAIVFSDLFEAISLVWTSAGGLLLVSVSDIADGCRRS
jgi:hypothetical protein